VSKGDIVFPTEYNFLLVIMARILISKEYNKQELILWIEDKEAPHVKKNSTPITIFILFYVEVIRLLVARH
jgi:hypothetical protein